MTWVKICGLSTPKTVATAVAAGADAVGFVIAQGSPRRVEPSRVSELAAGLPILSVLVTMDLPVDEVSTLLDVTGVDALQPHGWWAKEATAAALQAGKEVLFPVRADGAVDWESLPNEPIPLIDAVVPGGGQAFEWKLLGAPPRDFILAGGLTPQNVHDAVAATGAWGVDVSSGVESEPGHKDPELIRTFVKRAKS